MKHHWLYLFRRITIRCRKVLFSKKNSKPYLSGDFFSSLADFRVNDLTDLSYLLSFKGNLEVIFCKSELVPELQRRIPSQFQGKILIAGNSDVEFVEIKDLPLFAFERFFLQNSMISENTRVFTLPIGIENLSLGQNGLPWLMRSNRAWDSRKNKILVGPFSPTHEDRDELMQLDAELPFISKISFNVSPRQLYRLQTQFKYVACPRGNGIDTHRFWEVLYRGAVPVVKKSNWSSSLKILNLPMLEVDSWSGEDLQNAMQNSNISNFKPKDLSSLWAEHWKALFQR